MTQSVQSIPKISRELNYEVMLRERNIRFLLQLSMHGRKLRFGQCKQPCRRTGKE